MKENKGAWAAVIALLPPLIIAGTGWLEAHKEVEVTTRAKYEALDSYADYIRDRMERDEALAKALRECLFREAVCAQTHGGSTMASPGAGPAVPSISSDNLDDLAEQYGYEQKQAKP